MTALILILPDFSFLLFALPTFYWHYWWLFIKNVIFCESTNSQPYNIVTYQYIDIQYSLKNIDISKIANGSILPAKHRCLWFCFSLDVLYIISDNNYCLFSSSKPKCHYDHGENGITKWTENSITRNPEAAFRFDCLRLWRNVPLKHLQFSKANILTNFLLGEE